MEAVVLLDRRACIRHLLPPDATCGGSNRHLSFRAYLRFRRGASCYARLAHLYSAVGIAFVWRCYGQILGPRGHLPKFAYSLWRRLDAWVHLDSHLIWQATERYVERCDAFGLVPHECSSFSSTNRKKRPPHLHLACQVDPIHDAWKFDIRKDHRDVSPADEHCCERGFSAFTLDRVEFSFVKQLCCEAA